jgi:hypothetical protein
MGLIISDGPTIGPTIQCEICKGPTTYTGTRRCNRCWELEMRIRAAPMLARQILESLNRKDKNNADNHDLPKV